MQTQSPRPPGCAPGEGLSALRPHAARSIMIARALPSARRVPGTVLVSETSERAGPSFFSFGMSPVWTGRWTMRFRESVAGGRVTSTQVAFSGAAPGESGGSDPSEEESGLQRQAPGMPCGMGASGPLWGCCCSHKKML